MIEVTIIQGVFAHTNKIFQFKSCERRDYPDRNVLLPSNECEAVNQRQFWMTIAIMFFSFLCFLKEMFSILLLTSSIENVSFLIHEMGLQNAYEEETTL